MKYVFSVMSLSSSSILLSGVLRIDVVVFLINDELKLVIVEHTRLARSSPTLDLRAFPTHGALLLALFIHGFECLQIMSYDIFKLLISETGQL